MRPILLLLSLVAAMAAAAADSSSVDVAGQKIYVAKCARCHKLYNPLSYSDGDWDAWMPKMKKKAHLSDREYQALNAYVHDLREKPAGPGKSKN